MMDMRSAWDLTKACNQHHGQEGVVLDADERLCQRVVKYHRRLVEGRVQVLEELVGQRKEGQVLHAHPCVSQT